MVTFAAVQDYEDASGVTIPVLLLQDSDPHVQIGGQSWVFYNTAKPNVWIVRYLVISGSASGTNDGSTISLAAFTGDPVPGPWPGGGSFISPAAVTLTKGRDYWFAWSTDLSVDQTGQEADFGTVVNTPLPSVYLGPDTALQIVVSAVGISDNTFLVREAWMQIERYAPGSFGGDTGTLEQIYLLPVNQ